MQWTMVKEINEMNYGLKEINEIEFFFNWDSPPSKPEQPLRDMELQEKKHKKDCRIQKMFRKNLQLKDVC